MPKEINLLPKKNIGFFEEEQTIIISRVIAIFSVIIVISGIIGIWFLDKNYSPTAISAQQAALQERLVPLQNRAVTDITLVNRVNAIAGIIKNRLSLIDTISTVQSKLPSMVTIQSLTITKEQLNLEITSASLSSLQTFMNTLTNMVGPKNLFQKMTITSVSLNATSGLYTADLEGILQ